MSKRPIEVLSNAQKFSLNSIFSERLTTETPISAPVPVTRFPAFRLTPEPAPVSAPIVTPTGTKSTLTFAEQVQRHLDTAHNNGPSVASNGTREDPKKQWLSVDKSTLPNLSAAVVSVDASAKAAADAKIADLSAQLSELSGKLEMAERSVRVGNRALSSERQNYGSALRGVQTELQSVHSKLLSSTEAVANGRAEMAAVSGERDRVKVNLDEHERTIGTLKADLAKMTLVASTAEAALQALASATASARVGKAEPDAPLATDDAGPDAVASVADVQVPPEATSELECALGADVAAASGTPILSTPDSVPTDGCPCKKCQDTAEAEGEGEEGEGEEGEGEEEGEARYTEAAAEAHPAIHIEPSSATALPNDSLAISGCGGHVAETEEATEEEAEEVVAPCPAGNPPPPAEGHPLCTGQPTKSHPGVACTARGVAFQILANATGVCANPQDFEVGVNCQMHGAIREHLKGRRCVEMGTSPLETNVLAHEFVAVGGRARDWVAAPTAAQVLTNQYVEAVSQDVRAAVEESIATWNAASANAP
jgi:hypothetical protein